MKLKKLVLRMVGVALFAMLLFAAGSAIAQRQQRETATTRVSTGAAQRLLFAQAGHANQPDQRASSGRQRPDAPQRASDAS